MFIRLLLISFFLLLIACGVKPISEAGSASERSQALNIQSKQEGYAVVYVYRLSEFNDMAANYLVGFDPNPVAVLENSSFTRFEIPPGVYKFNFASSHENYNKPAYAYSGSGDKELEVRANAVNFVHFDAYPGSFSDVKYGEVHLKELSDLDYILPTYPIVDNIAKLSEVLPTVVTKEEKEAAKKLALSSAALKRFNDLKLSELCKLKNESWVYTGEICAEGFAHGMGSSEDNSGLKFVGEFEHGKRVKGEIFQNGGMIFSGALLNDKPHGNAICFHDGEHEECRFYDGKRIDTLYKIRKENAKIAQEMERIQEGNVANNANQSSLADNVQKEMLGRAASLIFDSLF